MFKKSLLTLLATLSLGGALFAQTPPLILPPPPVVPATTITTLPFTITTSGAYVLGSNLALSGSLVPGAITIQGPIFGPVTIDLQGFTISATTATSSATSGISVSGLNNNGIGMPMANYPVTVSNGTVTGFFQGVGIYGSANITISHIVFKQVSNGVSISSSSEVAIDNCRFNGANGGIYDASPEGGNSYHHNTFVNCQQILSVQGNRVTPVVGGCRFNSKDSTD
jgi:Right handed beta helix region